MLAWLGGKRRQNRLKAAAHTRAARLGSGAPDGLGRIPAPLQHRAWLQEHDSQADEGQNQAAGQDSRQSEALLSRKSFKSDLLSGGVTDVEGETAGKQRRACSESRRKSAFIGTWASVSVGSSGKTDGRAGGKGYDSKVAPLASLDQRAIAMSDAEDEQD